MNPSSDADTAVPGQSPGTRPNHAPGLPTNWREALMTLIASRVTLVQLESKDAAQEIGRRLALIIAAIVCGVFSWALLIAGIIALISRTMHWPWFEVAIMAGVLHLLLGLLLGVLAKPSAQPSFPITRAEFQKDREWIENFHKNKKSSD